ncbi:MAG: NAD(P)/FAD-dependent oxidoreductase [Candidatus Caldatribacteriaceae bacterium]
MGKIFDVVIIGGGIVGCAVAWYLAHFDLEVLLIEKAQDVCCGVSKANTGIIHSRSYWTPSTLKGDLHLRSLPLFSQAERELDISFPKVGALTVAFARREREFLETLQKRGNIDGAEIIGPQEARNMEPLLNPGVFACYYDPETRIISPFTFNLALAEFASLNGVHFVFGEEVTGFESEGRRIKVLGKKDRYVGKRVVNCGGLHSTQLAHRSNDPISPHQFFRGQYFVLDRECATLARHVLYPIPTEESKGILVSPTPEGNILVGPNFEPVEGENTATTIQGLKEVEEGARRLIPSLPLEKTITIFSGLRPTLPERDFRIFFSSSIPGLLHLCGIESPGLTASLGIAEYVGEKLQHSGVSFREKKVSPRISFPVFRTCSLKEREHLISKNPDWGRIICRCEEVTLAEVKHALSSPIPARTLDGLKRRIRVMAGRCQGSFCGMHLPIVMMQELGYSEREIIKSTPKSVYLLGKIENVVKERASTL